VEKLVLVHVIVVGPTVVVFFFVFVAGVFADLLESQQGLVVMAGLCGLLSASAIWNLWQLARLM